jgi:LPXTG-site transpeptidase (sortase) family protein
VKKDDLLEKQLEKLFSDTVLPKLTATLQQRLKPATEATPQPGLPLSVGGPKPASRWRLFKPKWLSKPKWVTGSLSALAVYVFLLVGQGSFAQPANTPRATSITTPRILAATDTPTLFPPTSKSTFITATAGKVAPTFTLNPPPTVAATDRVDPTPTLEPIPTAKPTLILEPTPTPSTSAPSRVLPTRLVIPVINMEAPIITVGFVNYEINGQPVTTWAVPDTFAAGWHHTSAPPGQAGNTVLNGHQNIHGMVFRDLAALKLDDEIIVYADDAAYHYRVTERHVVEEEGQPLEVRAQNARWIMPTGDERLTLVTCVENTHRLIVIALPLGPTSPSVPGTQ